LKSAADINEGNFSLTDTTTKPNTDTRTEEPTFKKEHKRSSLEKWTKPTEVKETDRSQGTNEVKEPTSRSRQKSRN
jgi:hypothetical protein